MTLLQIREFVALPDGGRIDSGHRLDQFADGQRRLRVEERRAKTRVGVVNNCQCPSRGQEQAEAGPQRYMGRVQADPRHMASGQRKVNLRDAHVVVRLTRAGTLHLDAKGDCRSLVEDGQPLPLRGIPKSPSEGCDL